MATFREPRYSTYIYEPFISRRTFSLSAVFPPDYDESTTIQEMFGENGAEARA